jgi:hypothetical protein
MNRLVTFSASIVFNLALLTALQLDVYLVHAAPRGEVSITELDAPHSPLYAQAANAEAQRSRLYEAAVMTP